MIMDKPIKAIFKQVSFISRKKTRFPAD